MNGFMKGQCSSFAPPLCGHVEKVCWVVRMLSPDPNGARHGPTPRGLRSSQ